MGKRHKKRDDNQRHRNREDAAKESEAIIDENDQVYTVEILKIIKEAQQIHGLRHEDYRRYRTYCSNKVHRLRHLLKLVQGDKRHYRKKNVNITHLARKDANPKLLQIPLFLAERAWAYAMEIRSETGDNSRKRFHMIRRLKKAAFYAGVLDDLCQTKYCDAQTELESKSYVCFIRGTLNFELQNWEKAAENFKQSHIIYENLASTITDVANRIYKKQADDINHSLRFCYYNLDADGHDIDIFQFQGEGILGNLDLLLQQTKKRRTEELRDLVWYDLNISVRPEKVRTFLFAIQSLDKSLATVDKVQEKIKLLDQILVDCRDVIAIANDDMKLNKHSNEALITYLTFIRLTRTVQRDTLMMEQADKEKNVTRWYDIIIELMDELAKLPQVKDNDQYKRNLQKIAYFKPIRFISLGKVYEKKRDHHNYTKALQMYENAFNEANNLAVDDADDDKLAKLMCDLDEHKARVTDILDELEDKHTTFKDVEPEEETDQFLDAVGDVEVTLPVVAIPKSAEKKSKKTKKTAVTFDKKTVDTVAVAVKEIEPVDVKVADDDGIGKSAETAAVNPGGLKGLVKGLWSWGSQNK